MSTQQAEIAATQRRLLERRSWLKAPSVGGWTSLGSEHQLDLPMSQA